MYASGNFLKGSLLTGSLILLLAASTGVRAAEEYIQYDFSNPADVFKATTSETVVGQGIDPAVLYDILRTGQIVIVNDNPNNPDIPWLTTGGILVNAPPEQVFAIIEDIDSYPSFMPEVEKAGARPVNDEVDHVFYELGVQILFVKVKVPYSVYHWNRPPHRVDWVMAGGDFAANMGAYEVVAVPGQTNRSMLFYTSYAEPKLPIVQSLYSRVPQLDMMINLSTGTLVVKAMKKRAEELFAAKGGEVLPAARLELLDLAGEHPQTLARLASRGKMVVLEDTDPMYYTGAIIVNKPRDFVFEQISDFEGMSSISKNNFMTVLERGDNTARVRIRTAINLIFEFDSEYVVNYTLKKPRSMTWVGETGGDIEGVAGSWELTELDKDETLVLYRNTSDLSSSGVMMRQLLKIEPTFELAIQASQTQFVTSDTKRWCEASPDERKKAAQEAR